MAKRRKYTDQFKAKVALEALRSDKTVQEIAAKHPLHPNQVSTWKWQAIDEMVNVFSGGRERVFVRRAEAVSPEKKRAMIKRDHPELSISQQCKLLRLSRSSFF